MRNYFTVNKSSFELAKFVSGSNRSSVLDIFWYPALIALSSGLPGTYWRTRLLRAYGAKIRQNCIFRPGLYVKRPWSLRIGNDVWIGRDVHIDNVAPLIIGGNTCISQGVKFCNGNHRWDDKTFRECSEPIHIHSGVWVGAYSVIGPGVRVSFRSIVAMGTIF